MANSILGTGREILRHNARVEDQRVIQALGEGDEFVAYLSFAGNRGEGGRYWLVEAEDEETLTGVDWGSHSELIEHRDKYYTVMSTSGASVAFMSTIVDSMEWGFICWRWQALAANLSFYNQGGGTFQKRGQPFDLAYLLFDDAAWISTVSRGVVGETSYSLEFPPPEAASGMLTPASDVYSIGMSLLYLLGYRSRDEITGAMAEGILGEEKRLRNILQKATADEPLQRYSDLEEFAEALEKVLPKNRRDKPPKEPFNLMSFLKSAGVFTAIFIVIGAIIAGFAVHQAQQQASRVSVEPRIKAEEEDVAKQLALQPTAETLTGTLEMADFLLDVLPEDQQGCLDIILKANGNVTTETLEVQFEGMFNGEQVYHDANTFRFGDVENREQCDLTIDLPKMAGLFEVMAMTRETTITKRIFISFSISDIAKLASLDDASIVGLTIDMSNPDEMQIYYGLATKDGTSVLMPDGTSVDVYINDTKVPTMTVLPATPDIDPVTVAMVVDVSGSMRGRPISAARTAASAFIRQLGPNDKACVWCFATDVQCVQPCTGERQSLLNAIHHLEPTDETSLYDAILRVGEHMNTTINGRRAIVILSDGADTTSSTTSDIAMAYTEQMNIPIYTIGLKSPEFDGMVLEQFAEHTHGMYLQTPNVLELERLYQIVQNQLEHQYRISYPMPDGPQRRSVIVELSDGENVIRAKTNIAAPKDRKNPPPPSEGEQGEQAEHSAQHE